MATLLPEEFVAQTTLYTPPFLPQAEKTTTKKTKQDALPQDMKRMYCV